MNNNNTIAQAFERSKNQMLNDINELVNNTDYCNADAINYLKSLEAVDVSVKSYYVDDSLECGEYEIKYADGSTQQVDILYNETWNPFIQELINFKNDVTANELAHFLYNWLDENIDNVTEEADDIYTETEFREWLTKNYYHPQLIEILVNECYNKEIEA
jgi:hypothetical protein